MQGSAVIGCYSRWYQRNRIDDGSAIARNGSLLAHLAYAKMDLESISSYCERIDLLVNAAGLLHTDHIQPEKRLSQARLSALESVFRINALAHCLFARGSYGVERDTHVLRQSTTLSKGGSEFRKEKSVFDALKWVSLIGSLLVLDFVPRNGC